MHGDSALIYPRNNKISKKKKLKQIKLKKKKERIVLFSTLSGPQIEKQL